MRELKIVNERLFKTDLSNKKIDLTSVSDLSKLNSAFSSKLKEVKDKYSKYKSIFKELSSLGSKIEADKKDLNRQSNILDALATKIDKSAQDLGVTEPKEVRTAFDLTDDYTPSEIDLNL